MANLSTSLNIDVSPFLNSIKSATDSVMNLTGSTSAPINITANTAQAESSIKAINSEVASLGTKTPPSLKIGADTSKAQHDVKELFEKVSEGAKKAGESASEVLKAGLGVFGGGALLGGATAIVGGLEHIFESGLQALEVTEQLERSFAQIGVTGEAAEKGIKQLNQTIDENAYKFGLSKAEVRGYSIEALQLTGATGQANDDLTKLAIGVSKATNGLVDGSMAIKIFGKGAADPEAQFALGKLTKSFPALAAELKGIKDPLETTQKALKFFGPTLGGLAAQADGPVGSMERFKNGMVDLQRSLGGVAIELITPLLQFISSTFLPIFQTAIAGVKEGFGAIKGFFSENTDAIKVAFGIIAAGTAIYYSSLIPALVTTAVEFGASTIGALSYGFSLGTAGLAAAAAAAEIEIAGINAAMTAGTLTAAAGAALIAGVAMEGAGVAAAGAWLAAALPIVAVIAGLAAVGLAVVYLYSHFEGFRNAIQSIEAIATAVFEGIWTTIKQVGEIVVDLGLAIFQFVIVPFQLWYEVASTIIGTIVSVGSSILGLTGSAEEGGGAVAFITKAFEQLQAFLGIVTASIKGVTAGIAAFAETAKKVIDAVLKLDFSGAVDAAKEGGKKMGEAAAGAFNEKIADIQAEKAQKKFEESVKDIQNNIKDGITINTKIETIEELPKLTGELDELQEKLKPLQVKIDSGEGLTDKEKKIYDKMLESVSEVSKKIGDVAPAAIASTKTIQNSNGELVQSYEINKNKIGEVAEAQKKVYGDEAQKNQNKFGGNLETIATQYDKQKEKLAEIKKKIDEANAKGDTVGAAKLKKEFEETTEAANKTGKQLKESFETGARAGLLTDDAAQKVAGSLNLSGESAVKLSHNLYDIAHQAVQAALDLQGMANSFDAAQKKVQDNLSLQQKAGADARRAYDNLVPVISEIENKLKQSDSQLAKTGESRSVLEDDRKKAFAAFAKETGVEVTTLKEAEQVKQKAIKETTKAQSDALVETSKLTKDAHAANIQEVNKDDQKAIATALEKELRKIEDEKAVRMESVRNNVLDEKDRTLKLMDIETEFSGRVFYEQEQAAQKTLALKENVRKGGTVQNQADIDAEKSKVDAISSNAIKKYNEDLVKRQEKEGEFAIKQLELDRKLNDERIKNAIDTSKLFIEIAEKQNSQSDTEEFLRIANIGQAKITALKAQNESEINEIVNKNAEVVKKDEELKVALKTGNKALVESATQAYADAVNSVMGTDAILNSQKKLQLDLQELQKANALELSAFNANLSVDDALRERELREVEIQKNLDAQLLAARGNERMIVDAHREASAAKYDSDELFARKTTDLAIRGTQTLKDLGLSIAQNLYDVYGSTFDAISKQFDKFAGDIQKKIDDVGSDDAKKTDDEAKKLITDLKAHAISYEEYQSKLAELQKKQASENVTATEKANLAIGKSFEAMAKSSNDNINDVLKDVSKSAKAFSDKMKEAGDNKGKQDEALAAHWADLKTDIVKTTEDMSVGVVGALGELAAQGKLTFKNAGKATLAILYDTVSKMVIVEAPAILAMFSTSIPVVGFALGLAAIASIEALLAGAKSKLGGFFTGGYTGDSSPNSVAGVVHGREVVFEHGITEQNKDGLLWVRSMLQGGAKINDLFGASHAYVDTSGSLQGMNYQNNLRNAEFIPQRNTNVLDVSGMQNSLSNIERLIDKGNKTVKSQHLSSVDIHIKDNPKFTAEQQKSALRTLQSRRG